MAIDSESKRRAAAGIRAPVPDGTLDADDRAAVGGIYAEPLDVASLPANLEDVAAELFVDTALEDELATITAELFVDTGAEVTMLGEKAGTIAWHFASGDPDRNVKGVFEEVRRPQLIEGEESREERSDARLHLPYNDTDGVEEPDRDDWVTVRGEDYDVLSIGSKQGGCRIIELVRTSRLHETASPVFGTL